MRLGCRAFALPLSLYNSKYVLLLSLRISLYVLLSESSPYTLLSILLPIRPPLDTLFLVTH